jgi:uncharacterized protein (DUF169 family)
MQHLDMLEREIGGTWVGVRFCTGSIPAGARKATGMRICEAIARAREEVIVLPVTELGCPGAARTCCVNQDDEALAAGIARKAGIDPGHVREGIEATPQIPGGIDAIVVGRIPSWDVAVSYTEPDRAMDVVRRWQQSQGAGPSLRMSTLMGVCGNVVAAAYANQRIYVSLGCPTARDAGILDSQHMVIGVPYALVAPLFGYPDDVPD